VSALLVFVLFSFSATKWVGVSAAIGGVLVFGGENGGALGHDHSQLEIALRHALRFP
jgi:hypothetical protein